MLFNTARCFTSSIGLMAATLVSAQSLDSHVHGASELNIARSGNELQVEFISPAFNLLGFERAPETEQERARFDAVSAQLESGTWLFGSALQACQMEVVSLELPAFSSHDHDHESEHHEHEHNDADHEEHAEHHHEEAGTHADFHVEYRFSCPEPPPADLEILAFDQFPGIAEITVQWITDQGQGLAELTAGNTLLQLR